MTDEGGRGDLWSEGARKPRLGGTDVTRLSEEVAREAAEEMFT